MAHPFALSLAVTEGHGTGHEQLMIIWPLLVVALVTVILAVTWLARRGLLGDLRRTIALPRTLAMVAAGLAGGTAVVWALTVPDRLPGLPSAFYLAPWLLAGWAVVYGARPSWVGALAGIPPALLVAGTWARAIGTSGGISPTSGFGMADLIGWGFTIGLLGLVVIELLPATSERIRSVTVSIMDATIGGAFTIVAVVLVSTAALISVVH